MLFLLQSSHYHWSAVHSASRWTHTITPQAYWLRRHALIYTHTTVRLFMPSTVNLTLVEQYWSVLLIYKDMFKDKLCLCVLLVCVRLTTQTIPLVNPTEETVKLLVTNSNPRHYTVEMDSGNTVSIHKLTFSFVPGRLFWQLSIPFHSFVFFRLSGSEAQG